MIFDPSQSRYHLIAACMMHVEGYYSTSSLAYKNQNPGNIEFSNGELRKFSTKQEGYDFLVNDIIANIGSSLSKFISKYAPPNENNTSLYLSEVSILTGIGINELV